MKSPSSSSSPSLVGSIFGNVDSSSTSSGLFNVFEASSSLPERPQHQPLPRSNRKKKKRKISAATDTVLNKESPSVVHTQEDSLSRTTHDLNSKDMAVGPKQSASKENDHHNNHNTNITPTSDSSETIDNRTIFVGNLPLDTTRNSLKSLFNKCGKVESTRLRSIAITGVKVPTDQKGNQALVKKVSVNTKQIDTQAKTSAQGYVVFVDEGSVDKAMELNNTLVGTHWIRVDRAQPTMDASRSVFVGNLPYQADETSLRQHFVEGCSLSNSDVENVRIVRDKVTQQCKGFGYVLFATKSMVTTALQRMHESMYKKRSLRVTVCGKRTKGRRGEVPENKRVAADAEEQAAAGALQRILTKAVASKKRKRGAGTVTGPKKTVSNPLGLSRRQASEAKLVKRHKKLQKRAAKGMGKTKKGF